MAKQDKEVEILKLTTGRISAYILGVTPLIYNSMNSKVQRDLLYPRKKTAAEKAATAKHDPMAEFQRSVYSVPTGPTLLSFPVVAFKRALASAALDLGGGKRTQMERLVWAVGEHAPVWGVPQLRMDVVRSADQNRTPDVRTRAILSQWACKIDLAFVTPAISETVVLNLLQGAGLIRGIGDFRQEKGAGNYGQFELVNSDDERWHVIVNSAGREAQIAAMADPSCYDADSEDLLVWWQQEFQRRGHADNAKAAQKVLS